MLSVPTQTVSDRATIARDDPACSPAERRNRTTGRRRKIEPRSDWDDAGRIYGAVAAVIMRLDVIEVNRLADARHLIERARVVPELGEIHQAVAIALEVAVVDRVEAHQGGEQPPVRFADLVAEQE